MAIISRNYSLYYYNGCCDVITFDDVIVLQSAKQTTERVNRKFKV